MKTGVRAPGYWRGKMRKPAEPRVVEVTAKASAKWGCGRMLIPTPILVDELICQVGDGKLVTIGQIRERLARDHQVDTACPLTTGIFLRIAAEAAEESRQAGQTQVSPYWRVVRDDGSLNDKFPGGVQAQASRLAREGHAIEPGKGKKPPKVKDLEKHLVKL